MTVLFTHCCPNCDRKRRMKVEALGSEVQCVQCGNLSIAADSHNESLAMMDTLKEHAELTEVPRKHHAPYRVPR